VSLPLLTFQNLSSLAGVVHAVSTRAGGISTGRCESLNVSYTVGDDESHVDKNLTRLAEAIGSRREEMFAAYQVHGRTATLVDKDTQSRPRCDVLLTQSPDRTLMLRFADCTPVLLADPRRRAVAAVHAGWRGSALRAAAAGVEALRDAFDSKPGDVLAAIGPAIGPCCYEVGEDVRQAFADRPWLFNERRLDLWQANREALREAGVPDENIEVSGICTRCQSERFFSHRANGGQPAGRFAAVIKLAC
jgi:polyphenol oxidase